MSRWRSTLVGLLAVVLAACAGPPPVPIGDRSTGEGQYQGTPDGHYRVRHGDTLYAIAFRYGLDWRDIAHWNGIGGPYVIQPDQLLRLGPPGSGARAAGAGTPASVESPGVSIRPAPAASAATTRPLETPRAITVSPEQDNRTPAQREAAASEARDEVPTLTRPAPADPPPAALPETASPGGDPSRWMWPTEGRILSQFRPGDPSRKGLDIAGEVGQPVAASAGGLVVYSGSGLIGYGELIIIKHSDRMLSAYAHNSRRLVSEGQQVAAGNQIAEMGTNDRNQAVLHFEIRVNGTPEDPLKFLPAR
jgi:lipoprotein NlpD